MTWSRSEKAIARKAFDAALKREIHELMRETKQIATQIKQPSDLWDLQEYLAQRREEIDRKYDYRYSQAWLQQLRISGHLPRRDGYTTSQYLEPSRRIRMVQLRSKAARCVNPFPTLASSSPVLSRTRRAISELPITTKSLSGSAAIAVT